MHIRIKKIPGKIKVTLLLYMNERFVTEDEFTVEDEEIFQELFKKDKDTYLIAISCEKCNILSVIF